MNMLFEPKSTLRIKKNLITLPNGEKILGYFIEFGLSHGPTVLVLPEQYAEMLKKALIEAASGIVVPDTTN